MAHRTFLHCADLHLGCKQFRLQQRWEDFGAAFSRIVTDALDRRVDFLLIAGDLFHHRNVNAATLTQAAEQLERLRAAQIPVWAIEGNHDRAYYVDGQSWMEYLHAQGLLRLLRPAFDAQGRLLLPEYDGQTGCVAMCQGVRVVGLGYLGAATRSLIDQAAEALAALPPAEAAVVLLHAAVDKMGADMAGVSRAGFAALEAACDYVALGHGHARQIEGKLHTPGAPEFVHAGEAAEAKGHFIVTLADGEARAEHIPSAPRAQATLLVRAEDCDQPERLLSALSACAEARPPAAGSMVRVAFAGEVPFAAHLLDASAVEQLLIERYGALHVEIENALNLLSRAGEGGAVDRALLERQVVREYVAELKPGWAAQADAIAEMALAMRSGAPIADWAEGALRLARQIRAELPREVSADVD